ncbi:MAG: hypothetical protein J5367_01065 [Lachnospiraceae bacterium]|nr:hypothetical protein [Lachnospiraceae bacterium]
MIAILFMIIGGVLVVISIIGFMMYLFQPMREMYQVVIKREDDYSHYISPRGMAYLQEKTKSYLIGLAVMFAIGSVLFLSGLYMKFGSRGFSMLFSSVVEESTQYRASDADITDKIDDDGDYKADNGKVYYDYLIIKGNDIYEREQLIGRIEDFESYVPEMDKSREIFVADDYASSSTFHEVIRLLEENGFSYEKD